ncbi:putative phenylalanine--tRNA ligase, mitochondrial [Armadillidium vulgare]|nr:putative phenylalanine--tRNA ligase, mitochondrial [Armadillidium vulgare]
MTNVTPKILSYIGKNLHLQKTNPLNHLRKRIVEVMYSLYKNNRGNPLFSLHDQLLPVVNLNQNFDSLLVPKNHVSRQKSDNYYINQNYLLRAHTTAHQVFGKTNITSEHSLFEEREITEDHQSCHSDAAVNFLTQDLKSCLISLATSVFGKDVEWRWVSASFPFTHPSWELEIKLCDKWTEILGCGIIKQDILKNCKLLSDFQITIYIDFIVELIDDFLHPKKKTRSHCYRITYRSWQKALMQEEANDVHQKIAEAAQSSFGVQLR